MEFYSCVSVLLVITAHEGPRTETFCNNCCQSGTISSLKTFQVITTRSSEHLQDYGNLSVSCKIIEPGLNMPEHEAVAQYIPLTTDDKYTCHETLSA